MKLCVALLALCPLATGLASDPVDLWLPPQPVPSQCAEFGTEVLLLNVSQSMSHSGEFERAQDSAAQYVLRNAPECTLLIVGAFGVTADVVAGEYTVDQRSRMRLAAAVRGLRANQAYTNRAEAAKLIELLRYQLRAACGTRAHNLIVRVYSTAESRGNPDTAQWTVAKYLARRMKARYVRISAQDYADGRLQILLTGGATELPHKSAKPFVRFEVGKRLTVLLGLMVVIILAAYCFSRRPSRRAGSGLVRLGVRPGGFAIHRRGGDGTRSDC